jgi:hypothetical protein
MASLSRATERKPVNLMSTRDGGFTASACCLPIATVLPLGPGPAMAVKSPESPDYNLFPNHQIKICMQQSITDQNTQYRHTH